MHYIFKFDAVDFYNNLLLKKEFIFNKIIGF